MRIEINLHPKLKIKPIRFYLSIIFLLIALSLVVAMIGTGLSERQEVSALNKEIERINMEKTVLEQQLLQLESGINADNYALRYAELVHLLETQYPVSSYARITMLREALPPDSMLVELNMTIEGSTRIKASLKDKRAAAVYLSALQQLAPSGSAKLLTLNREHAGYVASYELEIDGSLRER